MFAGPLGRHGGSFAGLQTKAGLAKLHAAFIVGELA
jgi:hypothetical protein